jgi:hypothetical protein
MAPKLKHSNFNIQTEAGRMNAKRWFVQLHVITLLGLMFSANVLAQSGAAVEAWFYLGRQNEAGAWAPASPAFRFDQGKAPKMVTVVWDAVLVDNINPDPAVAPTDPEAAKWTRVARRGPSAIPVLEMVRQESIGQGRLVWARVRVPGERVEVMSRP